MMLKYTLFFLTLPFILAGCASTPPTNFYLLQAIEANQSHNVRSTVEKITVLVKPVRFPEYLDRPQMVIRDNDYKLQLSEYHRWAEPLKDDFTRVFIENLNSRVSHENIVVFSSRDGVKSNNQLFIEVIQMDVNKKDQAILKVKWSLLSTEKDGGEAQYHEYIIPIMDASYEAGVDSQSKAIAQFSEHVAKTIEALPRHLP